MSERCLTMGCPEAVRVAKQDSCTGLAVPGASNGYVVSCIRNWSVEAIVEEGEASSFKSDCGTMVVRDKQDDQLTGYTISFETSKRINEFEVLVTGGSGIADGDTTIGTYKPASDLSCDSPSEDPRFIVEAFYKLSRCVSGVNHVRWVLPMVQFKVTEMDKEGSISFYRYTAETGIALANAVGLNGGPYEDFPADVTDFLADRDPDEYTAGFDFEENVAISGHCGYIEVPMSVDCDDLTFSVSYHDGGDPDVNLLDVAGPLTSVDKIVITTDGPATYTSHDPLGENVDDDDLAVDTWTDSEIKVDLTGDADGETVTTIELYGTVGELLATCSPEDLIVQSPAQVTSVTNSCPDGDGVVINGTGLDTVLGWFEIAVDCGVLRGYIAASEIPTGVPATAESPTSVTIIDNSYGAGPCNASTVTLYDGDGNIMSVFDIDPDIDIVCP